MRCTALSPDGSTSARSGSQSVHDDGLFSQGNPGLPIGAGGSGGAGGGGTNSKEGAGEAYDLLGQQEAGEDGDGSGGSGTPDPTKKDTCDDFPEYEFNPNEVEKITKTITIKMCITDRDALILNNFGYLYIVKLNRGSFVDEVFTDTTLNPSFTNLTGATATLDNNCGTFLRKITITDQNGIESQWKTPAFTAYPLVVDRIVGKNVPFCFECNPQSNPPPELFPTTDKYLPVTSVISNGFAGRNYIYIFDRTETAYDKITLNPIITLTCSTTYFKYKRQ
jgi:hypothetical protein